MLYSGQFQYNSPYSSGLDLIQFQDAKLTKIKDFHKRDAADVTFYFKGRLVRQDVT